MAKDKTDTALATAGHHQPPCLTDMFQHHQARLVEMKQIIQASSVLQQVHQELPDRACHPETDDLWLLRFLLNPKYTVSQAAERFLTMMQFRFLHQRRDAVEQYRLLFEQLIIHKEDSNPTDGQALLPHAEKLFAVVPERLLQTHDAYGQPVAVQCLGRSSLKQVLTYSETELESYGMAKFEYMRIYLDHLSRETNQFMQWSQVVDMHGLNMQHLNLPAFHRIKHVNQSVDTMYKECIGKIYVINAPTVFRIIYGAGKFMMNERTATKVTVLGGNTTKQQQALQAYMDPLALPDCVWNPKKYNKSNGSNNNGTPVALEFPKATTTSLTPLSEQAQARLSSSADTTTKLQKHKSGSTTATETNLSESSSLSVE